MSTIANAQAEVVLLCSPLAPTLAFFEKTLGFQIEVIFPADDPHTATISGHGLRVRLSPDGGNPGVIRIAMDDPNRFGGTLVAPNGTRVEIVPLVPPIAYADFKPGLVINRMGEGAAPADGRAGMIYRDLIPDRLGGRYIASHISIPAGGLVADWVHFHRIAFQMIFCRKGWVRVIYEDQGDPLVLEAGDCVLQPPTIRHRVLESSPGLEVVEVSCPAVHETLADPTMLLPTGRMLPRREYGGQGFIRHIATQTPWAPHTDASFECRQTGIRRATRGLADAVVLRPSSGRRLDMPACGGELVFGFLLEGSAMLVSHGEHRLTASDAFAIPPDQAWSLDGVSADLELLLVTCNNPQA